MGQETVYFRDKSFYADSHISSWVQKFMELFMKTMNHPDWFIEVINDLHGNFNIPYWTYFFDEEIVDYDKKHFDYCLKMIDLTIIKMSSISKKDFFEFIREDIKDSWCDISHEFYDDIWLSNNDNYKENYIGLLQEYKKIMENEIP